jgi:hypothetical protein
VRSARRAAARLATLLAALALASACGSNDSGDGGGGMGEAAPTQATTDDTPGTTTVVETVEPTVTVAPDPPPSSSLAFQTPSRNIGCMYSPEFGTLRCDILSGLQPEPEGVCQLDWTGIAMTRTGTARVQCAGDTVYDRDARVVAYGTTWARAGITCLSRPTGLRCTNERDHGFFLSRARWDVF